MYNLPSGKGNQVLYPDGTFGPRPYDQTYFLDPKDMGKSYRWDDLLGEWVDHKGEIFRPTPKHWDTSAGTKKCECGAHKVGVDKHSTWCQLYKKEE